MCSWVTLTFHIYHMLCFSTKNVSVASTFFFSLDETVQITNVVTNGLTIIRRPLSAYIQIEFSLAQLEIKGKSKILICFGDLAISAISNFTVDILSRKNTKIGLARQVDLQTNLLYRKWILFFKTYRKMKSQATSYLIWKLRKAIPAIIV